MPTSASDLLKNPDALLTSSHLRELGPDDQVQPV